MDEITDDTHKKIFIVYNQKEFPRELFTLNVTSIPVRFINRGLFCQKFPTQIKKADYLIINEILDTYSLNKLCGGNMISLVHGEYSDNRDNQLGAKKLIIITNCNAPEVIFSDELALLMRCKLIHNSNKQ